jgi:hypothetical protein
MSQPKPGDRFSFIYLDDEGSQPHQAIVQRLLSNREEGLSSPEADFYVAEWLEALPLDSSDSPHSSHSPHSSPPSDLLNPSDMDSAPATPAKPFTMMLSADCKTFIDGRAVAVTFDDAAL